MALELLLLLDLISEAAAAAVLHDDVQHLLRAVAVDEVVEERHNVLVLQRAQKLNLLPRVGPLLLRHARQPEPLVHDLAPIGVLHQEDHTELATADGEHGLKVAPTGDVAHGCGRRLRRDDRWGGFRIVSARVAASDSGWAWSLRVHRSVAKKTHAFSWRCLRVVFAVVRS